MRRPPHLRVALLTLLPAAAGCDYSSNGTFVDGGGGRRVQEVIVTPDGGTVQAGATLQFQARTVLTDGDTTGGTVTWTATGGNITTGGLFTAGQTAGAFRVVARALNGVADSVTVNVSVPATNPTLTAVVVTPATATVPAGGTVQFTAAGRLSNGASQAVSVTWSATGGVVSGTGLFTAGPVLGNEFRVVATGPGGLADSSAVTIIAGGT